MKINFHVCKVCPGISTVRKTFTGAIKPLDP